MYTFAVSQKFSWLPKITLITKTAAVHAVPLIVLQLCELSFDYSVAVSCTKLWVTNVGDRRTFLCLHFTLNFYFCARKQNHSKFRFYIMRVLHEFYRIYTSVQDRLSVKIRSARMISLCVRKHCITRLWIDFVVRCVVYLARVYFEQIINMHDDRVTWTPNTATQRAAPNCAPAKYGHTDAATQLAVNESGQRSQLANHKSNSAYMATRRSRVDVRLSWRAAKSRCVTLQPRATIQGMMIIGVVSESVGHGMTSHCTVWRRLCVRRAT